MSIAVKTRPQWRLGRRSRRQPAASFATQAAVHFDQISDSTFFLSLRLLINLILARHQPPRAPGQVRHEAGCFLPAHGPVLVLVELIEGEPESDADRDRRAEGGEEGAHERHRVCKGGALEQKLYRKPTPPGNQARVAAVRDRFGIVVGNHESRRG